MRRTVWNAGLVLILFVGLGWIWANRLPGGERAAGRALPPAPAIGHPAPDFTLSTLDGEAFTLAELRGTPVVLNFWASWCPPCLAEMPELESASQRYAGQVAIIGVNQAERPHIVQRFISRMELTFPIPLDVDAAVSRKYLIRSLPTTFFIDADGIIRLVQIGPLTEATLAQALRTVYP
jgi:cytochrome c biogenesis protein CcmG, thiol:disulfide interchange protein DsbE